MGQFTGALQERALTWYMTYTDRTPNAPKENIKQQFLSLFKTLDPKHLARKKIKSTLQKPVETVRDYDKRWKYLLR